MTIPLERPRRRHVPAIRLGHRSSFLLGVTTIFGIVAFCWPLLIHKAAGQNTAHSGDAPWVFVALVPLLIAIVMAELSEGGIDAKAIALLGILAACFSALRIASPGSTASSRSGSCSFWLDACSGEGSASCSVRWRSSPRPSSPEASGRGSRSRCSRPPGLVSAPGLSPRGVVFPNASFSPGTESWLHWCTGCSPTSGSGRSSGSVTRYSFVPGAGVAFNLHRFLLFDLTTSMGFDLTRAVTCAVLILVLGRPVLAALRRAARRAVFEPAPQFVE